MAEQSPSAFTNSLIQKLFTIVTVVSFVVLAAYQCYMAYQIYQHNPNLSSMSVVFLGLAAPIVAFVMSYLLHAQTKGMTRIFDSVLMAIVAVAIYSVLTLAVSKVFQSSVYNTGSACNFFVSDIITSVCSVLVVFAAIVVLRRRRLW